MEEVNTLIYTDVCDGYNACMSIFEAFLLGILQGIAEFLPISSSGHLALVQSLFGLEDVPLLFDVMLHLATLCAVILFFRRQIWNLIVVFFRWITRKEITDIQEKNQRSMILALILGTLVTGVMGIAASKIIPDLGLNFIFGGFLITAGLLILSSGKGKKQLSDAENEVKAITPVQGLLVGFAQGVGVFPGISRSGSTITGALFCGIDRQTAGEFSFILSIPAILGAFLLEAKDLGEVASSVGILPLIVGCITAFISGLFALTWLMKLIRKGKLEYFAFYLVPLAIIGLIFIH